MNVNVRLSAGLSPASGNPRFTVTLADDATVDDLLNHLRDHRPELQSRLDVVIPMVSGRHASGSHKLQTGQEVALLLPAAGG